MPTTYYSDSFGETSKQIEQAITGELKGQEREVRNKSVDVGFFDTARYQNGAYVADIAVIQEFGSQSGKIPARPFVEFAMVKARKQVARIYEDLYSAPVDSLHSLIGEVVKGEIQNSIVSGPWRPNAPSTQLAKARKGNTGGSPKPLIDTGHMRQSVTWKLNNE